MAKESDDETFTVSVVGVGIDIRREVSASKLAHVMSVLMGSDPSDGVIYPAPRASATARQVTISLREFLDDARAGTKSDQIVSIGHYMAVHEGKETFSRDDIKARFQLARERMPSNFPRDFSMAIGKGMIAEDHAIGGQFYVTKTGAQAIERRFGAQS